MKFEDFEIFHQNNYNVTFVTEDGVEELYQIIFTIESEKLNKKYAVFTKVSDLEASDGDDQISVGAAEIVLDENNVNNLVPIETDEEWEIVEQGLAEFDRQFEEVEDDECHCEECDHHHCYVDDQKSEVCECDGECDCHHHHHNEEK